MSFKSTGELHCKPKVTYQSGGAEADRMAFREAAALAIAKCTPLPLGAGLGGAIAGQLFRMTFELLPGRRA